MRQRTPKPLLRLASTALVLSAGCGAEAPAPPAAAAAAGVPVEIDPAPRTSIGVVEGDTLQELYRVVTPFVLADGRVVVPLSGSLSIRVFSADGAFRRTLGREGSGPGEFRGLVSAWARGDTIEALDGRLQRITRFLPDGSAEVVDLHTDLPDLSAVGGALGEGWAVGGVAEGGTGSRDLMVVQRIARDGTNLGELVRVDGMARHAYPGGGSGPAPLSPRAIFAVGGDRFYAAESLVPRVRVTDGTGSSEREITWQPQPSPEPEAVMRMVSDTALSRAAPDRAVSLRQRLEAAETPAAVSVLWSMLVDERGFLWIRPYDPMRHAFAVGGGLRPGPGGEWMILDRDGRHVGSVEAPADLELTHVSGDVVVGIARDSLGVETVRVHGLRRN